MLEQTAGREKAVAKPAQRAEAADLFVMSQGEMDRTGQRFGEHFRYQGEGDGDEAFHVGGAAAIQPAVLLDHLERVAVPGLAG